MSKCLLVLCDQDSFNKKYFNNIFNLQRSILIKLLDAYLSMAIVFELMHFNILLFVQVNTCPVCREEFPTDDPAYEEFRKYKVTDFYIFINSSVYYMYLILYIMHQF